MRFFILLTALLFLPLSHARAQDNLPKLPPPIQNLVDEGAQIRYLGDDHGFDAWMTIKNGQEQYFYVPPGGTGFVMGLLYDNDGKVVTLRQVQKLHGEGDELLDALANDAPQPDFQSPSERLFYDVQNSNWIAIGQPDAPVVYSFIDPQCPHCHAMLEDMRAANVFESGQLQLRLVPVGFREETAAQAAFLIAAPNPQERLFRHLDGEETALPVKEGINQQGVERNLAIMQSWKLNVTPLSVYRGKDGTVKMVRGRPQNLKAMLDDIGQ